MSFDEDSPTTPSSKPDDDLAFSRIKEEIEVKAKTLAENVITQAKLDVAKVLDTAKGEAQKVKNEVLIKAERDSNNIKVQDISRKKLALKMDYLDTREQLFDEIFVEARSKIQSYTTSDDYKKYLQSLLEISGNSIGGGDLILYVRKEDMSIFSKSTITDIESKINNYCKQKTEIKLSDDDLKSLGGLKLVRKDTKVFVDNTFEKRLERAGDEIRIELSELISE
ncbi:MAG: V-type ATP synthase subunit E [Candidatus Heimdallarchaeota archaeon LC_2]|nr:MAG: V-type ATP synthase subunit E [Candidatus Heimdallarchaeota archaeon LC_2]